MAEIDELQQQFGTLSTQVDEFVRSSKLGQQKIHDAFGE